MQCFLAFCSSLLLRYCLHFLCFFFLFVSFFHLVFAMAHPLPPKLSTSDRTQPPTELSRSIIYAAFFSSRSLSWEVHFIDHRARIHLRSECSVPFTFSTQFTGNCMQWYSAVAAVSSLYSGIVCYHLFRREQAS